MRIGIFDSGIGGISVLHEAIRRLPDEEYLFYADTDHVPYGIKTPEEVIEYVDEVVRYLIAQEVDAVLIACNTATSVAASYVRDRYAIPIIGMEPAVKPAVEAARVKGGRVLVMATPITIRENKLKQLLEKVDKEHIVDLLPMPGFVRMAESEVFGGPEVDEYIEEQLAVLDKSVYTEVVLGCTHFNYFIPAIKRAFGGIETIDGNEGTVRHLAEVLGLTLDENGREGAVTYIESGRLVTDEEALARYTRLHDRLEYVKGC